MKMVELLTDHTFLFLKQADVSLMHYFVIISSLNPLMRANYLSFHVLNTKRYCLGVHISIRPKFHIKLAKLLASEVWKIIHCKQTLLPVNLLLP